MSKASSYFRVLFDLQACQSDASKNRGVGNYSQALLSGIHSKSGQRDIFSLFSNDYLSEIGGLSESRILRLPSLPQWDTNRDFNGGEQDTLDSLALSAFISSLKADIIHCSHVFEGYGERIALPSISRRASGQIISATLYDTIPLIYPEYYLKDINFKKWYIARNSWLQQADLLLSISESTRQDAISLLGIDPWRIVTIHGGVSEQFKNLSNCNKLFDGLSEKYKIKRNFIFYTGGDDFRKNLDRLIEGYSLVPEVIRRNWQLVVACSIRDVRKKELLQKSKSLGICPTDVKILGFVPEFDLISLYNTCGVFIFPSLYEGLGLPVLEAMACGAPVIGGNNSSIKELITRPDALFDATSADSIASLISKCLTNLDFTKELREYGLQRVKEFTWSNTADKALDAFENSLERTRKVGIKCSLQGWFQRKRLALFTPLSPAKTGIADYNKLFLPYLKRYFDIDIYVDDCKVDAIDITSLFRIFNSEKFDKIASLYDVIFYDFGNSEFHTYMLPILERHPGIVCLHDAYLSGMFGYCDFNLGTSSYEIEMITSHKSAARKYFSPIMNHPNPNFESMVELPCTKKILDNALGVISHSPFNLSIALSNYPERWQAPYRIIPQPTLIPRILTKLEKNEIRGSLGFTDEDFIIASYGHIAWTKKGDLILNAFLSSSFIKNDKVHLVFAGELAKDDFGNELRKAINKSVCKHRIHITGFLSEQIFEKYLQISDLGIQLRVNSRGGTPKGVLDCLSHEVPVIINNDASYKDYPDDVLVKLNAAPSLDEIAISFEKLYSDIEKRKLYSKLGREYVLTHHNPTACAAAYATFINECIDRQVMFSDSDILQAFAPHIPGCNCNIEQTTKSALKWLNELYIPEFKRPRIFIDVSYTSIADSETGVARVVKEIIRELYCSDICELEVVAVELVNGELMKSTNWLYVKGYISETEQQYLQSSLIIEFRPGDILLMLDSSWARYREFFNVFQKARTAYVHIYTVIYDLLPITLPNDCVVEGGKEWFESWLRDAIESSDGLICISKSVALELIQYTDSLTLNKKPPKVGYWHLGADFSVKSTEVFQRNKYQNISSLPFLFMVGTIEPRKSHELALCAMEKIWDKGHELCLCIAGKEGWMVSDFMKKLQNHQLLNERLFFFDSPTDEEINYMYSHAKGLLFISRGEGFGLPLVEAANCNLPIICSDIPIFHEIAEEHVTYVKLIDEVTLADDIIEWWKKFQLNTLPDVREIECLSWKQSSKNLVDVIIENKWIN